MGEENDREEDGRREKESQKIEKEKRKSGGRERSTLREDKADGVWHTPHAIIME